MKADAMVWVQRIVGAIFAVGVVALTGAIVSQVGQAEGLPPLPIFLGLLGLVGLILTAGTCLALISLAISARRGAEALRRIAGQGGAAPARVFSQAPLREVVAQPQTEPAPGRPARPTGRSLVAER